MENIKAGPGAQAAVDKAAPASSWRTSLMAAGCFCFIAALMIGAAMKGAGTTVPKVLALSGLALIVISGIASLINWVSLRVGRGAQMIK
jgi:hypothetical protein